MHNNAAVGRGPATRSRRAGARVLAERTHVAETQQCPGSARDRRSVPPNRRLPTAPRRRYYSLSKFSRVESAGVARSGRRRMTIKGELHGTKRSASGGEPAQVPGGRRGGGCRHCAPAPYARGGGRDRNAKGVAADRRRRRLGLHG